MEDRRIGGGAEIQQSVGQTGGISGFSLHIFAMVTMLIDHIGYYFSDAIWLRAIGRLAFPIFAFLIIEGFFHTKSRLKYAIRLFAFGVISEVPFDLYFFDNVYYPFHQNVMWTFLISLLVIWAIDYTRSKLNSPWWLIAAVLIGGVGCYIGDMAMVDYGGAGVLMVFVFYIFREPNVYNKIIQAALMIYINFFVLGGWTVDITILGYTFPLILQGLAVFSLIFIWLYKGRHGFYNKVVKYVYYGFYPAHLAILFLLIYSGVM